MRSLTPKVLNKHHVLEHNVWRNLADVTEFQHLHNTWFSMIHQIIPSRLKLYELNIFFTADCPHCCSQEDLLHSLTQCNKLNGCFIKLQGWSNTLWHTIRPYNETFNYSLVPVHWYLPPARRKFYNWLHATTLYFLLREQDWFAVAEYIVYIYTQLHITTIYYEK